MDVVEFRLESYLRDIARAVSPYLPPGCTIVSATKGLEAGSLLRMSEVLHDELRGACEVVVLSGPSFASELARQLPTAIVAAGPSPAVVEAVMSHFRSPALRLYESLGYLPIAYHLYKPLL